MSIKMESNPYSVLDDKSSLRLKQPEQANGKPSQLSYVDSAIQRTGAHINWAAGKTKDTFDQVITPEQQRALNERYQSFAQSNPKLAAFLLINLVFSGVPILLFTIFSISVFAFSVITGLILGLIGALLFTSSVVGIALVFLVPTVLFTTIVATTIFFWGVVGLFLYTQYEQRSRRSPKDGQTTQQHTV